MVLSFIYDGAKPEYLCSVFLGAFSILQRKNDEIPDAALWPTSIWLNHDTKTAMRGAGAKKIGEKALQRPCFPDNNAVFAKGCQEREIAVQHYGAQ